MDTRNDYIRGHVIHAHGRLTRARALLAPTQSTRLTDHHVNGALDYLRAARTHMSDAVSALRRDGVDHDVCDRVTTYLSEAKSNEDRARASGGDLVFADVVSHARDAYSPAINAFVALQILVNDQYRAADYQGTQPVTWSTAR